MLSPELFLTVAEAILGRKMLLRFRAGGFSMLPFIREGDIITLAPVQNESVGLGDIAAAFHASEKKVFVHRIVKKNGGFYLLKGDNCPEHDGFVAGKNILGKVVKIERGGDRVMFGLGPERYAIAWLSRNKACFTLLFIGRKLAGFIKTLK